MHYTERYEAPGEWTHEQGTMLLGLVVVIFLILLALSIAAPTVARELRREREVEAVHRANQYVRAIQLYYRKTGTYPGSIEQLEKTNNIRFLRQKYVDPLTGKADWRLIHVGEAKTTVKGFFGKPLAGVAPGLGSAAGLASSGGIGSGAAGSAGSNSAFGNSSGTSAFGGASSGGIGGSSGGSFGSGASGSGSFGSSSSGSSSFGSNSPSSGTSSSPGSAATGNSGGGTDGSGGSGSATSPTGSSSGIASQSATSFTGGGAPFIGIGIPKQGDSIITLNEQTTYQTWEFLYDPRIEQLKAQANLFGGGPATGGSGLGSASSMNGGVGGAPGSGNNSGFGGNSSFGSSGSSGFGSSGSSSGSSFGSPSPSSGSSGTQPGTPPQQ